jgi:hypothetical protein
MPRSMVGLLAAAGVAMSACVGLIHGDLVPAMIAGAASASGLAAFLAIPPSKEGPGQKLPGLPSSKKSLCGCYLLVSI